ncbi:hypothetical protein FGIG_08607 [Fasciola gigantica]|uniref:Uncharacterized protein n=1 Tax=Fasciola gigantica TaxID=46835 RepID=A0A504YG09_FASGI|nr:hypothetical protein FGIG_08607 [Fasciola gigantica]
MQFVVFALVSLFLEVYSKRAHHLSSGRTNVTACDRLATDGMQETLAPGPLMRIVTMCRDDLSQLCTLIEFRGHLHVFYPLDENKTGCHTVSLDIRPTGGREQLQTIQPVLFNDSVPDEEETTAPRNLSDADVELVLTTEEECCTIYTRCFTIPLGRTPDDPLYGWRLNLTWVRTPEAYEFGEVGWSSVGAPIGSLSGVYDLIQVQLTYALSKRAGFPSLPSNLNEQPFVVSSAAHQRFQARVGDYYECASQTDIVMEPNNETVNLLTIEKGARETVLPGIRVILVMSDIRSQAFADVNVPEFTGASVVCAGDTSHDGTMSIVIGLSICSLVILVLLGLVISHLKDRDRTFKAVDTAER